MDELPAGPQPAEWARAIEALAAAERPLLICHVNPDGDALGSMLAVALGLARIGRSCQATFPGRFFLPALFDGMPGQELLVPASDCDQAPDLVVTFDAGNTERLGELAGRFGTASEVIVLDHHASNTFFGTVHLVDASAAATAVLAEELLRRMGIPLDREIAECLYVGLSTDTGSFKYGTTTPEVHRLAARLLETGIRPEVISRRLFDNRPFGAIGLFGEALGRARLDDRVAGGLVWTYATQADLARHGVPYDALESLIDVVRTAAEADVACVLKELESGQWAVSLRSKTATDVARVSVALGGGGHRYAAGFTGTGSAEEVLGQIVALL
ncbi:DHH family phosphoesterase [Longispora albida]|uniref:DHH family phosphoesterase n=1 Tax=Longispora albida TaxID=203523 RepID=UPI00039CC44E|nr:bifunctional oligoribonuclease/PAP phosphatase NrnA [Longispora albida]